MEILKIWQYCFANSSAMKAQIFMKFHMVVNYYLLSLNSVVMKIRVQICANKSYTRNCYSNWPSHKISWKSELWLWIYLQNNIGICLILNFQCIFHIFTIWASKFLKIDNISKSCLYFFNVNIKMETYQQNFPYNNSFNGVLDT